MGRLLRFITKWRFIMIKRTLLLLLFIGLAWCQNNGKIFLNNGMVYEGEIIKTDDSHLFFITPNNKTPQGIPLKLILICLQ